MSKGKPRSAGTPRVEYEEIGAVKKWPGNAKKHDLGFLGEAFSENGFAELPIIDEGTGRMVAGHGRLEKLLAMKKAGEPPPERVQVRGGKWYVPVIRGMTFRKPGKHVLASNKGVELGGWDNATLAAMLGKLGEDDLVGTGFGAEDFAQFLAGAAGPTAPDQFQNFDETLETTHECPKCQYKWSGSSAPRSEEPKKEPDAKPRGKVGAAQ